MDFVVVVFYYPPAFALLVIYQREPEAPNKENEGVSVTTKRKQAA